MENFTPIRNGIIEHLEQRNLTVLEFGIYMLLQLRADWATGIYRGCALTIGYQFGDPDIRTQVKDVLGRLKKKKYINYSPEKGKRGGYDILIHKFEPRVGRLIGTRLNAWKHSEIALPEYEPLASESHETRLRLARESPEARPIQEEEVRSKEVKTICSELEKSPAPEPAVMCLPCVGKGPKEFPITQILVDEWKNAFPGVDVVAQLRQAKAWLNANPKRRKTYGGVPRFVVSWLGRSQDRPGIKEPASSSGGNGKPKFGPIDVTPVAPNPEMQKKQQYWDEQYRKGEGA